MTQQTLTANSATSGGISPPTVLGDERLEELEFVNAMEEYCRKNDRVLPTWGEALRILRQLGYAKQPAKPAQGLGGKDWEALCAELLKERTELELQVKTLREERRYATNVACELLFGPIGEIDKEALLKEAESQPSIEELIAEFEATENE